MAETKKMDTAFKHFQNKDYKKALTAFDKLMGDESILPWAKPRLQQFRNISDRELNAVKEKEEPSLKVVSYYMNRGDYEQAENVLKKTDLAESHKAFLIAEMKIEQEDTAAAIDQLQKAIELDSCNIGYALNSSSFAPHLQEDEFEFLRKTNNEGKA